jgi:DNA-binding transcriptional LysR family regulator
MNVENLADLRVLVRAARSRSLTEAAKALRITPAAASATLKRLEAQLGTRLFERSTRAMRLTASGQILVDYAIRVLELWAEGESQLTSDRSAPSGTVRLAAPSDLARTTLLPLLSELLQKYPEMRLSLVVGDRALDLVRQDVDVAIRYGTLGDSSLVVRRLAVARAILCASPRYLEGRPALAVPQDLLQHNCLTFERGGQRYELWRFARKGQWTEVRVNGDRSVDDASLAREWALAGAGVILKSAIDVRHELASGALVRLLSDWDTEPYPLQAVLPSGRFVPQRVRVLVDFLAAKFAALARTHGWST